MIIDDERLVRSALVNILSSADDLTVVDAVSGREAVAALSRHRVDVVLCDVRMPDVDGLAVMSAVNDTSPPRPAVAMLTTFAADDLVAEALRRGAVGYLLKDLTPQQLLDAVRRLAQGDSVLSPEVTTSVIHGFLDSQPDTAALAALKRLTAREREVLALLASGESNANIAAQLYLSLATVKTHVGAVMSKLGVTNRVQAAMLAVAAKTARAGIGAFRA